MTKRIQLSERMQKIAELVIEGESCADVGTDHGLIPLYLLQNQICPSVYLTDIAEGPLDRARHNAMEYGVSGNMEFILGPGLKPLSSCSPSTVIIAGMGGEMIASILEESKEAAAGVKRFIFQPRTRESVLRKYLQDNGFLISGEYLVKEAGRICQIITVDRDCDSPEIMSSETDYEIPPFLEKNRIGYFSEFLDHKIEKTESVISELNNSDDTDKLEHWKQRLNEYKRIRSRI